MCPAILEISQENTFTKLVNELYKWVLTFSVLHDNVVQGSGQLFNMIIMWFSYKHFVMVSVPDPLMGKINLIQIQKLLLI